MSDYDSLEERVRAVELAIVQLSTMSKMMRALVAIVGLSLGVDISGVI